MVESKKHPSALVTGASGFIGSHLTEILISKGWHVRALVRKTSDLRWVKGLDIELAYGSFDDLSSLEEAVKGMDYVFHNAAAKSGSRQKIFRNNVDATISLAAATPVKAPGLKRFVFLSSQAASGPAHSLNSPKSEKDQCLPISDYGHSKLMAEQKLQEYSGKLPFTIIRPPTVYGPRDTDVFLYFQWINRGLALLPGLKRRYAHLIYVRDLVEGMFQAAVSEATLHKTYFLSDPNSYSWQEISSAIADSLGKKPLPVHLPIGLAHFSAILAEAGAMIARKDSIFNRQKVQEMSQYFWICSPESAQIDFGFKCRFDLKNGIEETARWYRENEWL
jgi:nucleoside-diphosphate-sugar epimerase